MKPATPAGQQISRLLLPSCILMVALFAVATIISAFAIQQNAASITEFYERPYQVSRNAIALNSTTERISSTLNQLINATDTATRESLMDEIGDLTLQRTTEFDNVTAKFTADPSVLDEFRQANSELLSIRTKAIDALQLGDTETARQIYRDLYVPQVEVLTGITDRIIDIAESVASNFVADAKRLEGTSLMIIVLLGLSMIAVVVLMWRRITRSIAIPVAEMQQAVKEVAEGDLRSDVTFQANNELGALATSINGTIQALRTTVERLRETAEQVARSSAQMSDSSQAVAQGSAEQAMVIEELATSVESITAVCRETTESALEAESNASDMLSAVSSSNANIEHAAAIIETIKTSTNSISQLANNIEDISFQTNILALNASVEAARAGEAGRGFSIVAEEIRRLASQVSEASRAADELAVRATNDIEQGSEAMGVSTREMGNAVEATDRAKQMLTTIAGATKQQLEAVGQIQESMASLSEVVQENSASSEESAVIGEELAEQARGLKELIDQFKLDHPSTPLNPLVDED